MTTALALIGLLLGLGVLAVVGDLLYRIVRPLSEIKRNVDDTLAATEGIVRNLGAAAELERTRELVAAVPDVARRYVGERVEP